MAREPHEEGSLPLVSHRLPRVLQQMGRGTDFTLCCALRCSDFWDDKERGSDRDYGADYVVVAALAGLYARRRFSARINCLRAVEWVAERKPESAESNGRE